MTHVLELIDNLWNRLDSFDYADRLIVFLFMAMYLFMMVFLLSQELTVAEQQEVAPAINALGYVLIFFLFWPIIRVIIEEIGIRAWSRWQKYRSPS